VHNGDILFSSRYGNRQERHRNPLQTVPLHKDGRNVQPPFHCWVVKADHTVNTRFTVGGDPWAPVRLFSHNSEHSEN